MAVRIVDADVEGIVEVDSSIPLTPFITIANLLTDRVVTCATSRGSSLTDDEAKYIEAWLSAHFYSIRDEGYTSKKTGDASATFKGQTGKSLDSTHYGQTAKLLDTSGCLAEISKDAEKGVTQASMTWLGKPPSEQTDYVDRD